MAAIEYLVEIQLVSECVTLRRCRILIIACAVGELRYAVGIDERIVGHAHGITVFGAHQFALVVGPFILVHQVIAEHFEEANLCIHERTNAQTACAADVFVERIYGIECKRHEERVVNVVRNVGAIRGAAHIAAHVHIGLIHLVAAGIIDGCERFLRILVQTEVGGLALCDASVYTSPESEPFLNLEIGLVIDGESMSLVRNHAVVVVLIVERHVVVALG